jgi:hypothetical protein
MNAFPAPIVSTSATTGARTSIASSAVMASAPVAAQRDERHRVNVCQQCTGGDERVRAGIEPGEVVLARLDHVGAGEQAPASRRACQTA